MRPKTRQSRASKKGASHTSAAEDQKRESPRGDTNKVGTRSSTRARKRKATEKKEDALKEPIVKSAATESRKQSKTPRTALKKKSTKTQTTTKPNVKSKDPSSKLPWYSFFTKSDPTYDAYMSEEWGQEKWKDVEIYEKLSLEGQQAGLSWKTILNKREAYRRTFHGFDVVRVSEMTEHDVDRIVESKGLSGNNCVVRHRGKIESIINNAKKIVLMKEEMDSVEEPFANFVWSFVDHKPILNCWSSLEVMPSKTAESEALSKALKKRGFRFVGPTTCYSMMQACGLVIDHPVNTPEWKEAKTRLASRPGGFQEKMAN